MIDSTGRFLYTSNQGSNDVSQFAISSSGALSSLGAAAIATQPGGICMDSQNRWLYATNTGGASVAPFAIQANGSLVSLGAVGTPSTNVACVLTADNQFLIVSGANLLIMPINQTSGIPGTAVALASTGGNAAAIDPAGNFLFNADGGTNTVRSFRINKSTGDLTPISSLTAGGNPSSSVLVNLYSF